MPTVTMPPNAHLRVNDLAPESGRVRFRVEGERPFEVIVTDRRGAREFRETGTVTAPIAREKVKGEWNKRLRFDPGSRWYLIIINWSAKPFAVHYDLYW